MSRLREHHNKVRDSLTGCIVPEQSKEMSILKLTLTKKWFDMVLSGEKPEEYRTVKDYWVRRLTFVRDEMEWSIWEEFCGDLANPITHHNNVEELMDFYEARFRKFEYVEFVNGYGDHRPRFVAKFEGIDVGVGNPAWGAPNVPVFIIKIGEIVSKENIV